MPTWSTELLPQLVAGITLGATYGLIGLGYNVMYGVLGVLNLAYGEIFMIGAMSALVAAPYAGGTMLARLIIGMAASIIAGVSVHWVAVRPLGSVRDPTSPRHATSLVTTIGAGIVLQNAAMLAMGPAPRPFPVFPASDLASVNWSLNGRGLFGIVLTMGAWVLTRSVLNSTSFGVQVRAIASNRELARLSGINVGLLETLAVMLAAAIAGLAAVTMCGLVGTASPLIGESFGFKALVVTVIGGLGRLSGTLIAGLLLGVAEALVVTFIDGSMRDAAVYVMLAAFLILSPQAMRQPRRV